MSSEHVEVLRDLSEVCRAAIKAGDWKVGGACDPDAVLRRADSAIAALSAPPPPAEAQGVAKLVNRKDSDGGKTTTFIRPAGLGLDLPIGEYPLHLHPPPSAPVGVEGLVRKVCERLDKVADYAHTIDDETVVVALSNLPAVLDRALSEALSQQPVAVDGDNPYPAPRNRQEAAALAKLALAYLGVTSAHIDAVVARCETDLAAQQGGSDNDR